MKQELIDPNVYVGIQKHKLSLDSIALAVCKVCQIEVKTLLSKSRKREVVDARKLVSIIAKYKYDESNIYKKSLSLSAIGKYLKKDHASAFHYIKKAKEHLINEPDFIKKFKQVNSEVRFYR